MKTCVLALLPHCRIQASLRALFCERGTLGCWPRRRPHFIRSYARPGIRQWASGITLHSRWREGISSRMLAGFRRPETDSFLIRS